MNITVIHPGQVNRMKISDLEDVNLVGLQDEDFLVWNESSELWVPGNISSMPGAPTFAEITVLQLISDEVLDSDGEFSTVILPSGFDNIEFEVSGRTTRTTAEVGTVELVCNEDTLNTNYRTGSIYLVNSGVTQSYGDLKIIGALPSATSPTDSWGLFFFEIKNHESNKKKLFVGRGGHRRNPTSIDPRITSLEWESTAVLTSVAVDASEGVFVAGSRFRVFGSKTMNVVTGLL